MRQNVILSAVAVLSFLLHVTLGSAQAPDGDPVTGYAERLSRAAAALREGNREAAIEALGPMEPDAAATPWRLLRQLASQGDDVADLTGTKAPRPSLRYMLGVVHPAGQQVAYACDLGNLLVFDLGNPEQEPRTILASRKKPLVHCAFSGDGKFLAAGDTEGGITIWDTESWAEQCVFTKGSRPVRSVALIPDGSRLLAETSDGVALWDVSAQKELAIVGPRYNFGTALAFSGDGRLCATGGLHSVVISSAADGSQLREIPHAPYTMHVAFSPDGKSLASGLRGSLNSWLGVFDTATGEKRFDQARHERGITGLVFVDDGQCLLATSADGTLKFWHVPSGTQLLALNMGGSIYQPSTSADGSVLFWNQRGGPRYFRLQ